MAKARSSQVIQQALNSAENRGVDLINVKWIHYVGPDDVNQFEIFEEAVALGKKAQSGDKLYWIDSDDNGVYFLQGKEADLVAKLNAL